MSFDTSWDIEKYKSKHESEEHWTLKQDFLLAHKDKYAEARLIALANCFLNIKFLGCKYPEKVMDLVKELSEGIGVSSEQSDNDALKRTFVAGSDAAGSRYKRNSSNNTFSQQMHNDVCNTPVRDSGTPSLLVTEENSNLDPTPHTQNKESENTESSRSYLNQFKESILFIGEGQDLISNAASIVQSIFNESRINAQFEYSAVEVGPLESEWKCELLINDQKSCTATAKTKPDARKLVFHELLKQLRTVCFTIREKVKFYGQTIERSSVNNKVPEEPKETMPSSIGSKMMMNMGWNKGKGLGAREQGILEPVSVNEGGVARSGLGSNITTNEFKAWVLRTLEEYKTKGGESDLIFSKEFTKDERIIIHTLAQKRHLKTRSYGSSSNNDRHLIITKHAKNNKTILNQLLKCGGENTKYVLEYPTTDV